MQKSILTQEKESEHKHKGIELFHKLTQEADTYLTEQIQQIKTLRESYKALIGTDVEKPGHAGYLTKLGTDIKALEDRLTNKEFSSLQERQTACVDCDHRMLELEARIKLKQHANAAWARFKQLETFLTFSQFDSLFHHQTHEAKVNDLNNMLDFSSPSLETLQGKLIEWNDYMSQLENKIQLRTYARDALQQYEQLAALQPERKQFIMAHGREKINKLNEMLNDQTSPPNSETLQKACKDWDRRMIGLLSVINFENYVKDKLHYFSTHPGTKLEQAEFEQQLATFRKSYPNPTDKDYTIFRENVEILLNKHHRRKAIESPEEIKMAAQVARKVYIEGKQAELQRSIETVLFHYRALIEWEKNFPQLKSRVTQLEKEKDRLIRMGDIASSMGNTDPDQLDKLINEWDARLPELKFETKFITQVTLAMNLYKETKMDDTPLLNKLNKFSTILAEGSTPNSALNQMNIIMEFANRVIPELELRAKQLKQLTNPDVSVTTFHMMRDEQKGQQPLTNPNSNPDNTNKSKLRGS